MLLRKESPILFSDLVDRGPVIGRLLKRFLEINKFRFRTYFHDQ